MPRFDHILIANRGEIAMRVIRTARAAGYRTTAVYSEADADAPHVRAADHAVLLGPASASLSYLATDRILDAARRTGAGAIHPGYGFLSENADFAAACEAADLVFIGPRAETINLMGNKAEAKRCAERAGVPCVPGFQDSQRDDDLAAAADAIGYPVMVKAAAGGGGRGMRLAADPAGFAEALRLARSEASSAFGSDEMILEKAILRPRHIEVQVLADEHGSVVHLGERDCSVQRRHQKIIEEAPSPSIDEETRAAITAIAVRLARAIGYLGAGTVEFIVDREGRFYFIEMNTRLQVEHPVTELVTGIDLVAQQIQVAQGLPLAFGQDDVRVRGHAIEARLYAEDAARGFMPSTGMIGLWRPADRPGVRIDAGVRTGQTVTPNYDPMLAKVIAHGDTRAAALSRLDRGIAETILLGPETNAAFLRACIGSATFASGVATTAFLAEEFPDGLDRRPPPPIPVAIAAALFDDADRKAALARSLPIAAPLLGWSSDGARRRTLELSDGERVFAVELDQGAGGYRATVDGSSPLSIALLPEEPGAVAVDGVRGELAVYISGADDVQLHHAGAAYRFSRPNPLTAAAADGMAQTQIRAPMHGLVTEILVAQGDAVRAGDALLVLEAMKVQNALKAKFAATVARLLVRRGDQVQADALLIELEPASHEPKAE